ncbi:MAG: carbohydrate-binding family 9-like protein [Pyrinomonadaceae bacterium]
MQKDATIVAPFTATNISVAEFDHSFWQAAPPASIHRLWSGTEAPASRHAEARIIWNDETLTVRFICNQLEPLLVNSHPDLSRKKIGLWETDVCELFIAPGSETPSRYLEFEVAPTGEWIDLVIDFTSGERRTNWEFHSGMIAATLVSDGVVAMAMQVPWNESLPKPEPNDVWRGNLFRCIGVGNERYLAWQPTGTPEPLFHVPDAFGWIQFVG